MIKIKTAEEIELMREPCRITRDVLDLLKKSVKEGMSTLALDKIAFEYIKDCGAEPAFLGYYGYPASTCISLEDMVVHGIPNEKSIIKPDMIVSVDVGAVKNGFVGDAARSFYVGEISAEKKKLIDVTQECFFEAVKDLRDGTPATSGIKCKSTPKKTDFPWCGKWSDTAWADRCTKILPFRISGRKVRACG